MQTETLRGFSFLCALALIASLAACRGQGALNSDEEKPGMTDSIIDADPTIDRSPGADFKLFNAVFVDFPDLATDATQGDDVDASQLADLRAKLQKDLESVFFKRYARAAAAGPNVLVVHSKIVRAVPNKPFKNIAPLGRAVGAGRGYAAIEATLCNGANGAVLLRYTDTDATSRFGLDKFSTWGAVEKAFEHWADALAKAASN